MKKILTIFFFYTLAITAHAQSLSMYPTHWFTGMQWNKVQLLLRADNSNIGSAAVRVQYPGVTLNRVHRFDNGKYLAIDLNIAGTTKPGNVNIALTHNGKTTLYPWLLKPRRAGRGKDFAAGVTSADLVYLLMPDRFSNGNPLNDQFASMRDTACNRDMILQRHGGDLQGVEEQIGYLKELGVTALWMCPVIENDMPLNNEAAGMLSGYHGYWFTNQYQVDKRFGGNEAYQKLSGALHANGLKLVQDAVYNHIGSEHWMAKDPPANDWINQWQAYTGSNHREEAVFDGYGSGKDRNVMLDGWFVPHLPDVNQRNPYVANYLVQHAIWSTEEFGVDGWRVDTYKYCDEPFLNRINNALLKEYPQLTIFGEAWANTVTGSAYFTRNNLGVPFKHNAEGVTDFPMNGAIMATLNQSFGWTEGVNRLYMTLAQDLLYKDAKNNCIFLDNHDMDRFYSMVNEDMDKFKQGIGLLLTLRGIPQLYYGTEILMKNFKNPNDAMVRLDFPGGFPGDAENKFTAAGRNAKEQEAFNYISTLAHFRKTSTALTTGHTMQFIPSDGLYVYFRYDAKQTIMCVVNTSDKDKPVSFSSVEERTKGFTKGRNIMNGASVNSSFTIPSKKMWMLELGK